MDAFAVVDKTKGYYWKGSSKELLTHKDYDPKTHVNDIGLVQIIDSAPMNSKTNILVSSKFGQKFVICCFRICLYD